MKDVDTRYSSVQSTHFLRKYLRVGESELGLNPGDFKGTVTQFPWCMVMHTTGTPGAEYHQIIIQRRLDKEIESQRRDKMQGLVEAVFLLLFLFLSSRFPQGLKPERVNYFSLSQFLAPVWFYTDLKYSFQLQLENKCISGIYLCPRYQYIFPFRVGWFVYLIQRGKKILILPKKYMKHDIGQYIELWEHRGICSEK